MLGTWCVLSIGDFLIYDNAISHSVVWYSMEAYYLRRWWIYPDCSIYAIHVFSHSWLCLQYCSRANIPWHFSLEKRNLSKIPWPFLEWASLLESECFIRPALCSVGNRWCVRYQWALGQVVLWWMYQQRQRHGGWHGAGIHFKSCRLCLFQLLVEELPLRQGILKQLNETGGTVLVSAPISPEEQDKLEKKLKQTNLQWIKVRR